MSGRRGTGPGTRWAIIGAVVAGAWLVSATAAWAPHVPQLNLTPAQVRPGDSVAVLGTRGFGYTNPVQVRFNAPDGPVLGTFQPDTQVYAAWGPGNITIPPDTKPGTYTIYATQILADTESHIRGIPARATIEVIGPGGAPALGARNAVAGDPGSPLLEKESPGVGPLLLLGAGVAGTALLFAGAATMMTGRKAPAGTSKAIGR